MRRLAGALALAACLISVSATAQPLARDVRPNQITVHTAYDSDYFYIAAQIRKATLKGTQARPFSNPMGDDWLGVFLQVPDSASPAIRTVKSVQMVVSVAGGAQLYRGAAATPLSGPVDFAKGSDGGPIPFKYGISRQGDLNGPSSSANGYTVEMAIPWAELGTAPKAGDHMRFNVVAASAAPDAPTLTSLSPAVKTIGQLQNPSLWADMVFVEAAVRTVASAPDSKVCARVYTARPLMDGVLQPGEWNPVTGFVIIATDSGTATAETTAVAARFRPERKLNPARPATPLPVSAARAISPRTPQQAPHLVMALYHYDFQADRRKPFASMPVTRDDYATMLTRHPMDGCGPWMTYDRLDWHAIQLAQLRQAGIDVLLPVYRAGIADKQRYSQRGLTALAGALRAERSAGRPTPRVAMYLDTASLSANPATPVDLRTPEGEALLYGAIRDFFLQIPQAFRATIPLSAANGGGVASIVVLSSAAPFSGIDASFYSYIRGRFLTEFGDDLIVLGGSDFAGKAPLDGYLADVKGRSAQPSTGGWVHTVAIGPAAALAQSQTAVPPHRLEGQAYRANWARATESKADWAVIDSWNTFREGTEIAPSMETGMQYVDLTRACARAFAGAGNVAAAVLAHDIPAMVISGATPQVRVRMLNTGATAWSTTSYALAYRWAAQGQQPTGEPVLVPLLEPVAPGSGVTAQFALKAPVSVGAQTLWIDVALIGKKGDVTGYVGGTGGTLAVPVRVATASDESAPKYAATLIATDLPSTAEAGGSYTASVTMRNDGRLPWKKGDARIGARLWRAVSGINGTGEKEAIIPVEMADASADVPADVPPGQEVAVTVPISFARADGAALPAWSPADNWTYQLRWEIQATAAGGEGAYTAPEALALVDEDMGVQFVQTQTPQMLPAEKRLPVRVTVRNRGPQAWRKTVTRIGYHWYYLDGTEAVWEDETTPLPADVLPGSAPVDLLAYLTAPPFDGSYYLVWDVKIGDTWASTTSSARERDTAVTRVDVIQGRLSFVNLDTAYNEDGIAPDNNPGDGDFDLRGHALPAELVPPYTDTSNAPSTLWLPARTTGLDSPRRISFRWGSHYDREKNVIACHGQRIVVATDPRKAPTCTRVHLLMATIEPISTAAFTLHFADSSEMLTTMPVGQWDVAPQNSEEIAWSFPYTRIPSGDDMAKSHSLFHYTIRAAEQRKLMSIKLPDAPAIKIVAITVER